MEPLWLLDRIVLKCYTRRVVSPTKVSGLVCGGYLAAPAPGPPRGGFMSIRKVPGGFKVFSAKGKPLSRVLKTRGLAEKRLFQVEPFKRMELYRA